MATYFSASKIIVLLTFAVYVMLGNTITASRVFVTVSLYGAIRLTVTHFFPSALEKLFESLVSIERIQVRGSPHVFPQPGVRLIGYQEPDGSKHLWGIFGVLKACSHVIKRGGSG
jgi:hypothetical protein